MRTVLVENMRYPRSLGRPLDYMYPLPKTPVFTSTTDNLTPCYESTPVTISTAPAFMLMCKAPVDIDAGSIRLLFTRQNMGFAAAETSPAFTYKDGMDHAEVAPIRISELGGGNVFVFATTALVETFRLRLLFPVESIAVYLLTPAEVLRYRVGTVDIALPIQPVPTLDPFLADNFEQEP